MILEFAPYILKFKRPAGTSRGTFTEKPTCYLRLHDESSPDQYAYGEAAIFPGLSPEADDRFFYKLMELVANFRIGQSTDLSRFPSLQCGLEQCFRDFAGGCRGLYFPSAFTEGEKTLTINGLIWMGEYERMLSELNQKIEEGFKCIKIKVGAIDWRQEVSLIEHIRKSHSPEEITIRVDANGGFSMEEAIPRLKRLADLGVHSIEQPIKAGNPELMSFLCKVSPTPIALDEELIGKFDKEEKQKLLDEIMPAYIVLKPTLTGGFSGTEEWIKLAEERGIGWWITSCLESNIGLNAIAQWTATLDNPLPQGLGTGKLFIENPETPIYLDGENLEYDPNRGIDREWLKNLDWRS
ncbi:MAG: o-succinylbenzoate synthase [Muribaculaceae bacterium]|nr:o-succinylbenzoate synthase [Muribaculaceae bacterium]